MKKLFRSLVLATAALAVALPAVAQQTGSLLWSTQKGDLWFPGLTPSPQGSSIPGNGSFANLSATSTVSGTGFTTRFATPGPIGNTVASTGAFTTLNATGQSTLAGGLLFAAPNVQSAATYTVAGSDLFITANFAGTVTLTLGTATAGRQICVKTITANTVVSASSNVVPAAGGAAGTAILAATAGKWACLVGDGTAWQNFMQN